MYIRELPGLYITYGQDEQLLYQEQAEGHHDYINERLAPQGD